MNKNSPLISIIVPVYNTSLYLEECVNSLVCQSLPDIEIILVDDGSTDNSGELCDEYARRDARITVIHQKNGGLAQARNSGMAVIRGKYTMFVDSDDWVDTTMCESLLDAMLKNDAQVAMCSYVREYADNSLVREVFPEDVVFCGKEVQRRLCGPLGEELRYPEKMDCLNMMCGKLYVSALLKGTDVTDISVIGPAEDLLYNFTIFSNVRNMVYVNRPYYHYRKIDASITATYKPDLEEQLGRLYDRMAQYLRDNQMDAEFETALNNRIAVHALSVGLNCVNGEDGFFSKCKRMKNAFRDDRRKRALKQLSLKHMPIHWKVFYFGAKHNMSVLLYVMLTAIQKLRGKM